MNEFKINIPESASKLNAKQKQELIEFCSIVEEILNTKYSKMQDYGDSWSVFGLKGLIYQIGSKFLRIWNLKDKDPKNESLYDSFKDGAVYNIMAVQLIQRRETSAKI